MFNISNKGKCAPKDIEIVCLQKNNQISLVSELYKDWNPTNQRFIENSGDNKSKNYLLQKIKLKYLKIAERWNAKGKKGAYRVITLL